MVRVGSSLACNVYTQLSLSSKWGVIINTVPMLISKVLHCLSGKYKSCVIAMIALLEHLNCTCIHTVKLEKDMGKIPLTTSVKAILLKLVL